MSTYSSYSFAVERLHFELTYDMECSPTKRSTTFNTSKSGIMRLPLPSPDGHVSGEKPQHPPECSRFLGIQTMQPCAEQSVAWAEEYMASI